MRCSETIVTDSEMERTYKRHRKVNVVPCTCIHDQMEIYVGIERNIRRHWYRLHFTSWVTELPDWHRAIAQILMVHLLQANWNRNLAVIYE
jgi:hypothetical protein